MLNVSTITIGYKATFIPNVVMPTSSKIVRKKAS